jgi:integrase/recombinase XerC
MKTSRGAMERFDAYLKRRNYAAHTRESYRLDLTLFFADKDPVPATVTHRDIEQFIERHYDDGLAPTTLNRRLYALKHFFDFLLEERLVFGNPVKASHFARLGRPLPKPLSPAQVQALFAQMHHPMDRALFGVMLRGGLRVSEVVKLERSHIDWEQRALLIAQGKGRKDRVVYLCADAIEALQACLAVRPKGVATDTVFWNRKRPRSPLSVNAIQKKMQRLAKAAGIEASCHRLRHTFASTLLENGAELVSVKELLGHAKVGTSERYARVSNQRVKQEYQRTMRKVLQRNKV